MNHCATSSLPYNFYNLEGMIGDWTLYSKMLDKKKYPNWWNGGIWALQVFPFSKIETTHLPSSIIRRTILEGKASIYWEEKDRFISCALTDLFDYKHLYVSASAD